VEFTLAFFGKFFWGVYLALPPLFFLCAIIIVLGLTVGRKEEWNRFDSIYWAFVTALTVGYGDFRPTKKLSKVLALIIALVGMMLFGIIVAITVNTFSSAFHEYVKLPK
jgi:voltage-gated potassium channel